MSVVFRIIEFLRCLQELSLLIFILLNMSFPFIKAATGRSYDYGYCKVHRGWSGYKTCNDGPTSMVQRLWIRRG